MPGALRRTLTFLRMHPLSGRNPLSATMRYFIHQARSRLIGPYTFNWIGGARLNVEAGLTGATGNVYCGLHEPVDMAFALHILQEGDLFVDAGANIGSYTVLAAKVCESHVVAVEPDPTTTAKLIANVDLNFIGHLVEINQVALGPTRGSISFTLGQDTTNQVAQEGDAHTQTVIMERLDDIIGDRIPTLIKMDVEGFEIQVLRGSTRTINNPNLLAVITESQDDEVVNLLTDAGLYRRYYNPFTRKLSSEPSDLSSNNALFVRDDGACERRVRAAPYRQIAGVRL